MRPLIPTRPTRPTRPTTHRAIEFGKLAKYGSSLEEVAEDGVVDFEAILDLASELGVGAQVLMAAIPNTELQVKASEPIRFEVCVGGCQEWGALDVAERLIDVREQREDDGGTLFDIVPRSCLDKCQSAAAVVVVTPDGRAVIEKATVAAIDEALETI